MLITLQQAHILLVFAICRVHFDLPTGLLVTSGQDTEVSFDCQFATHKWMQGPFLKEILKHSYSKTKLAAPGHQ